MVRSSRSLGSRRLLTQTNSRHAADLAIRGTLHSVDQFLNIKLLNVAVEDTANFPHMVRLPACPLCDESSPTLLDARMRPSSRTICRRASRLLACAAIGEELLRPWLGHPICAAAVV